MRQLAVKEGKDSRSERTLNKQVALGHFFFSLPGHYMLKEVERNYDEQTRDCIPVIYKLRIKVHLFKPEGEECFKGLLKLSCLETEKSRNQENGESIVYMP